MRILGRFFPEVPFVPSLLLGTLICEFSLFRQVTSNKLQLLVKIGAENGPFCCILSPKGSSEPLTRFSFSDGSSCFLLLDSTFSFLIVLFYSYSINRENRPTRARKIVGGIQVRVTDLPGFAVQNSIRHPRFHFQLCIFSGF